METIQDIFGDVIYSYSRMQALEDGVLVDVSDLGREAGLKFRVAVTRAIWAEYISVPDGVIGQDERGRAWDIVWMLRMAIKSGKGGEEIQYSVLVRNDNRRPTKIDLKALCGPGDDMEPVITIMKPDED
jgi:hypothetical protein